MIEKPKTLAKIDDYLTQNLKPKDILPY